MKRADILNAYRVRNSIITSPGKFEGAPIWAPHFWALVGLGEGERIPYPVPEGETESGEHFWQFVITPEDEIEFPELKGSIWVCLEEDSQGFINAWVSG
jgi:hypothetical protein